MKRIIILFAIISLYHIAAFGQKKYEMVIEKSDGSEVVINTEDIVKTYFREISSGNTDQPGGEDSGTNITVEKLVGIWQVYRVVLTLDDKTLSLDVEPKDSYEETEFECDRHEFKSDGSYQLSYYIDGRWKNDGSGYRYRINGNKIILEHGNSSKEKYTVDKLTENELIFTDPNWGDDGTIAQYYMNRVSNGNDIGFVSK